MDKIIKMDNDKVAVDNKKVDEFLKKLKSTCVDVYSIESLENKLRSGKKLIIKLGMDPSRPDLHLGHTVVLRQIKRFQDLGHQVVFIVGDYTAMIGDPSGKSKTRPVLTFEETRRSGETYLKQVTKILNKDKTILVYNSEWLARLSFAEVLELAGKYTVARLLERDDFSKRFKANQPIGMHEMFYPLMQGFDSVAIRADVEIGGTDQTFNMLVGRELEKDYGMPQQDIITFPLLPGLDGVQKMSKSLDNYIVIDEDPGSTFEKCMKVQDNLLESYYNLTTDLMPEEYLSLLNSDIVAAHYKYAELIVEMYHGKEAAANAKERYLQVASGKVPQAIANIMVKENELNVIEMLQKAGFVTSTSEARKLVQNKGIKVDGKVVEDFNQKFDITLSPTISKGKSSYAKFIIVK